MHVWKELRFGIEYLATNSLSWISLFRAFGLSLDMNKEAFSYPPADDSSFLSLTPSTHQCLEKLVSLALNMFLPHIHSHICKHGTVAEIKICESLMESKKAAEKQNIGKLNSFK
jgi:hypothetical protein